VGGRGRCVGWGCCIDFVCGGVFGGVVGGWGCGGVCVSGCVGCGLCV